jgi:hypothetical protein
MDDVFKKVASGIQLIAEEDQGKRESDSDEESSDDGHRTKKK